MYLSTGVGRSSRMKNFELKRIILSSVIPFTLVLTISAVFLFQYFHVIEGYKWGIYPRLTSGLIGVFFSPFFHADWSHLLSNIVSLFVLATGVFYFYRDLGLVVILICWLFGGTLTWILGREAFHIGASGLVYGLASFLFFSGIVRQNIQLLAVSLIVVVQYGGLVWGLLPIFKDVSFESHIFGGISGFLLAIVLRNKGPQMPLNVWNRDFPEEEDRLDWEEEQAGYDEEKTANNEER